MQDKSSCCIRKFVGRWFQTLVTPSVVDTISSDYALKHLHEIEQLRLSSVRWVGRYTPLEPTIYFLSHQITILQMPEVVEFEVVHYTVITV